MAGNQDFIAIWLPTGKKLPIDFARNTSFSWTNRTGNLHVFAWPVEKRAETKHRRKNHLVCGTPVSRVFGKSIDTLISDGDFENIAGPFAILKIKQNQTVEILNDAFGIHPLFWFQDEKIKICGTRADIVAHAASALSSYIPSLNIGCIKMLVVLSQAEGNQTAIQKINVVPFGHKISLDQSGMNHKRYWPIDWRQPPESQANVRENVLRIVDGQISALKNLVAQSEYPLEIDLTGGKDSRSLLAMCHKAKILDKVVFLTQGVESFPDVKIASNIAKSLDLNYVVTDWLPPLNPWEEECKMRALESFGRRGCMEGALPKAGNTWRVKGFLGETWRTCYPNRREPKTMEIVLNFHRSKFRSRKPFMDPLEFQKQLDKSEARLHRIHNRGNPLSNITDIDFITQYQRVSFSGRIRNFDRVFLGLYAPKAHRIAFSLGLDDRRSGWMMQQAFDYCGLNIDVPFTKQILEDKNLQIKTVQSYVAHGQRKLQSEKDHWAILEKQMHLDVHDTDRTSYIKDLLLPDPNHPIFQWVSYEKIRAALTQPMGFNLPLSKMLLEITTGKLWMDEFADLMNRKSHYFG